MKGAMELPEDLGPEEARALVDLAINRGDQGHQSIGGGPEGRDYSQTLRLGGFDNETQNSVCATPDAGEILKREFKMQILGETSSFNAFQ